LNTEPDNLNASQLPASRTPDQRLLGVRRVPDKNGEVDPTIFPAVSDMQLGA
jgi:hypothetical protein